MNIIAAVDKNWAIGYKNQLLVKIPADMKFFREMTMGKVVIMGRKTMESLPNKMPLAGRTNIVLSRRQGFAAAGAKVVHSIDELHHLLEGYDSGDVYVIGGESIYRQLLDECSVAHITKIEYAFEADAYFPNLGKRKEWEITSKSEEQTYFDLEYYDYKYERHG